MFFYSFKYCSILRQALSLAPLIALRNFTQRRMAKNEQLLVLRHYMYATYTKVLILLSNLVFFCCFDYPRGFFLCVGQNGCHKGQSCF